MPEVKPDAATAGSGQPEISLRELEVADYPAIVALWERAGLHIRPAGRDSADAFAAQLARGSQRVIGLRAESELIAVAVLTHDGRKGWINRLAVDPAFRRRGLAARLVSEAERWFLEDQGIPVWSALIESRNTPSRALFEHLGYEEADIVYVSKRVGPDV
jgi:GNAT superfamily N-acetyltransferase